jgi:hypothetical protein
VIGTKYGECGTVHEGRKGRRRREEGKTGGKVREIVRRTRNGGRHKMSVQGESKERRTNITSILKTSIVVTEEGWK